MHNTGRTSVNQIPAAFKKIAWKAGQCNFDNGGGRFDKATVYLQSKAVFNIVYDPVNRTRINNDNALKIKAVDTSTICNVLNVIESAELRKSILQLSHAQLKYGGKCYISVYEKRGNGIGEVTRNNTFQANRKLGSYLEEVKAVFNNARIEKGMIIAEKL